MTILTTLKDIQAITRGDDNFAALQASDTAVQLALASAENFVSVGRFGKFAKDAQTYLAAHLLSLSFTDPGGRGPLSSESVGDVSVSYTLPYLNQTSILGSTQYGLMYMELEKRRTLAFMVVAP